MVQDTITASVQSTSSTSGGTMVTVRVTGPRATPDFTRTVRAKARAISAVGPVNVAGRRLRDISLQDIQRLTRQVSPPTRESAELDTLSIDVIDTTILETTTHRIKVLHD